MSFLGQFFSSYGGSDLVGINRNIKRVISLGNDDIFTQEKISEIHDRCIDILAYHPNQGIPLKNNFFSINENVTDLLGSDIFIDRLSMGSWDACNFDYQNLVILGDLLHTHPMNTMQYIFNEINQILSEFPLSKPGIEKISHLIESTDEKTFDRNAKVAKDTYGHIGLISFFEGCITAGKSLSRLSELAKSLRDIYESDKENSMEYWDFNNIMNLAETRIQIDSNNNIGGKSFSLSGGSGNTFAQLAFIYEHLKNGGTITSISGTSAGSAIGVLVGMIGNDADRIKELMDDLIQMNYEGVFPIQLKDHEDELIRIYKKCIDKFNTLNVKTFNELHIPVLINASREYNGGEQEIILSGNEDIVASLYASMNVSFPFFGENNIPYPFMEKNVGRLGKTPIQEVNLIDYAVNQVGNPIHLLSSVGIKSNSIVVLDNGYSSNIGGSGMYRFLFKGALNADLYSKYGIILNNGTVIDLPLFSHEGYSFPSGTIERFFEIGKDAYKKTF